MKPLEVWTCQRAENLRRSHRKFKKITTQQKWYRRRADKLSAAGAARRSTKSGGGGAHKNAGGAGRGAAGAQLYTKVGKGVAIVIPQDPNALVEMLSLRMASFAAGNTGVRNEI